MADSNQEKQRGDSVQVEPIVSRQFSEMDRDELIAIANLQGAELENLKNIIKEAWNVCYLSPELNMSNYCHDEVAILNSAMCEAFSILDAC